MKHPLHKKMPLRLDIQIRTKVFFLWLRKQQQFVSFFGGLLAIPAIALLLFIFQPTTPADQIDTDALVASIREAQELESKRSAEGIYHVRRVITEGAGKPDYVTYSVGKEISTKPRTDIVETWQHNDTALALIESNGTERSFEAFLSLEHNGTLALHHYGPKDKQLETGRPAYDAAHDLASLYTAYSSLERPEVPTLPAEATFLKLDASNQVASFLFAPADGLEIEYQVDVASGLVTEEIIYVLDQSGKRFEMTRVVYLERSIVPTESFDEIFNPEAYAYQQV